MNSQNNNNDAAVAFGFVAGGTLVLALFVFALVAFLALILTIAALTAWNRPRTYFGETITPDEARRFIRGGIIGAFLLPVFVAFSSALLAFEVVPEAWTYLFIGGYCLGSIGSVWLKEQAAQQAKANALPDYVLPKQEPTARPASASTPWWPPFQEPIITPPPRPSTPEQSASSSTSPEMPFRFASWDDEEELRK